MKKTMLIDLNARTVRQFGKFETQGSMGHVVFQVFTTHCEHAGLGAREVRLEFGPLGLFSNCEDVTVVSRIAH